MNDDLVKRLREPYEQRQSRRVVDEFQAADRIEQLETQVRAADAQVAKLQAFAKECASYTCTCSEAYVGRQMLDPDCMAGEIGYLAQELLGQPITCRGMLEMRERRAAYRATKEGGAA